MAYSLQNSLPHFPKTPPTGDANQMCVPTALTITQVLSSHRLAPLAWHMRDGSHPELVGRAGVEPRDDLCGFLAVVCVHPLRLTGPPQLLHLHNVLVDATIGVLRGLPGEPDGVVSQGFH